jgi:hypothetical protein
MDRARVLVLEARVEQQALKHVRSGLPRDLPMRVEYLFAQHASVDIPVGTRFGLLFEDEQADHTVPIRGVLVGVTQQYGRPFDAVPRGWKTVCAIEFSDGVPRAVESLAMAETWGQSKKTVSLVMTDDG